MPELIHCLLVHLTLIIIGITAHRSLFLATQTFWVAALDVTAVGYDEHAIDVLVWMRRSIHEPVCFPGFAPIPKCTVPGEVAGSRPAQIIGELSGEVTDFLWSEPKDN